MKRSTNRILTTHVGSLVRPLELRHIMAAREQETAHDESAFEAILRRSIAEVVEKQAEVGIDVISDGEYGKTGWNRYVAERMDGFVHREVRPDEKMASNLTHSGESKKFAEFYAAYDVIQKFDWLPPDTDAKPALTPKPPLKKMVWECVGPIKYRGQMAVERDIENFRLGMKGKSIEQAFLPVAAPMSARGLWINSYYPDEDAVALALAEALKHEYRAIVDAGLLVQIDDAFLADQYGRLASEMGEPGVRKYLESRIEMLNHALEGIPEDKIRYHVCWGSWNGPHTTDVPLKTIVDLILKVKAQAYSIEAANPRHEHEWQVWKDIKLPEGKILIPGLVSHCTNVVEHPELVAWRIQNFANVIGYENVIAGTDCGFSQSYNHVRVHPSIQWAKLSALVEGARMASHRLRESRAA